MIEYTFRIFLVFFMLNIINIDMLLRQDTLPTWPQNQYHIRYRIISYKLLKGRGVFHDSRTILLTNKINKSKVKCPYYLKINVSDTIISKLFFNHGGE